MKTLTGLFILSFALWLVISLVSYIQFNRKCAGYLERASNANTMELASTEIGRALDYLRHTGDTTGYTSIIYQTPDEDIDFWYKNLVITKAELDNLIQQEKDGTITLSPVDKSNQLIKVRETLVDSDSDGTSVIYPSGLYIFPYNTSMAFFGWISFLLMGICIGILEA